MIRRELAVFLLVGGSTALIDYASYEVLGRVLAVPVDLSKAVGFLLGTVYAFFANRTWTFGHQGSARQSAWKFALLYATTLGANVGVNAALLYPAWCALPRSWAFIGATGVSATLNFLGMKYLVFRPPQANQPA